MQAITSWFIADPRRLCVLGVWLSLAGLLVTFLTLAAGMQLGGLLGGVLLTLGGERCKVVGRDRFRRQRTARARTASATGRSASRRPASHVA